jgi:hypothetical protein
MLGSGKAIAIGCAVAVLGLISAAVALIVFVDRRTAEPEQCVRQFLAAAASGELARAHDYFSAPLQESLPLGQFKENVGRTPELFDVADMSFNRRSISAAGARLSGTVTLKTGASVPASFHLVQEDGRWRLFAYSIGAPAPDR